MSRGAKPDVLHGKVPCIHILGAVAVERDHLCTIVGRNVRPCEELIHHLVLLDGEAAGLLFATATGRCGFAKLHTAFTGQRDRGKTNSCRNRTSSGHTISWKRMFPYDLRDALPFRVALSLRTPPVFHRNNHHYRCNGSNSQEREQQESTKHQRSTLPSTTIRIFISLAFLHPTSEGASPMT